MRRVHLAPGESPGVILLRSSNSASSSATATRSFGRPAARCKLNQSFQGHDTASDPSRRRLLAEWEELLVSSAAGNFAEKVDCANLRGQCEVEAGPNRSFIPPKRQTRWCTAQVRLPILQCFRQSFDIVIRSCIHDIDILGRPCQSVYDGCPPANNDVLHAKLVESSPDWLQRCNHRDDSRPFRSFSPASRHSWIEA